MSKKILFLFILGSVAISILWYMQSERSTNVTHETSTADIAEDQILESRSPGSRRVLPSEDTRTVGRANPVDLPQQRKSTNEIRKKAEPKVKLLSHEGLRGTGWKIWPNVTAARKGGTSPVGIVVGEVNGYVIFESSQVSTLQEFDPNSPIIVFDEEAQKAGVLTGTVAVILEDGASSEFLTGSKDVQVVGAFPDINTYYVTSAVVPFDLGNFKKILEDEPEVKSSNFEVLSRQYEKF